MIKSLGICYLLITACILGGCGTAPTPLAKDSLGPNELKTKALAGDVPSQLQLGAYYDQGKGVRQNYQEASRWYAMAAAAGDANAQNNLGSLYLEGAGVKKDYAKAREFFNKAAEKGNANALCSLGYMQEHGLGTPVSTTAANDWYRKAAEKGNVPAMYNLGQSYMNGTGIEKDLEQSFVWFKKAAEGGMLKAQHNLAIFYENGVGNAPTDIAQAIYWYRKAAEQGSIQSLKQIGEIYVDGKGTEINLIEAYGWLEITRTYTLRSPDHHLKWETRGLLVKVMKQLSESQIQQGNQRARQIWVELYKESYHSDPDPKSIPTFFGMPRAYIQ